MAKRAAPQTKTADQTPPARLRLLAAAENLFARDGFEGATTRAITDAAQVNISAIPYYFGDKKGLYAGVLWEIAALARQQIVDRSGFLREALADPAPTLEKDREALHRFIHLLADFLMGGRLSDDKIRLFLREQMDPTPGFSILYNDLLRPMHEALTQLVARAAGLAFPSEQATLATHALLGQIIGFKTHREAILRRLSWKKTGPAEIDKIVQTVIRHSDFILTMYRQDFPQATKSRRRG